MADRVNAGEYQMLLKHRRNFRLLIEISREGGTQPRWAIVALLAAVDVALTRFA